MVPIAPFAVFGFALQDAKGMVLLAYLIGMVGMLFTALSYAAMSQAFPLAGSVYAYVQRGLHESAGFLRRLADPAGLHSGTRPPLPLLRRRPAAAVARGPGMALARAASSRSMPTANLVGVRFTARVTTASLPWSC